MIPASNQSGFCLNGGVVDGVSNDVPSLFDTVGHIYVLIHSIGRARTQVWQFGPGCVDTWMSFLLGALGSFWLKRTLVPTSDVYVADSTVVNMGDEDAV